MSLEVINDNRHRKVNVEFLLCQRECLFDFLGYLCVCVVH